MSESRPILLFFLKQFVLRLFQHTFGTHPEQPLPTGKKRRDSFYSWRTGYCLGCARGVCCNFLGFVHSQNCFARSCITFANHPKVPTVHVGPPNGIRWGGRWQTTGKIKPVYLKVYILGTNTILCHYLGVQYVIIITC